MKEISDQVRMVNGRRLLVSSLTLKAKESTFHRREEKRDSSARYICCLLLGTKANQLEN
jgi:hypothetical protein